VRKINEKAQPREQGDQIGRIFAQWVIVYFGQFYKDYRSNPNFWATLSLLIYYVIFFGKKWLGFGLGDFFHKLI
jgi:hypothetical protein